MPDYHSPLEAAYVAGIVDADGCIRIVRRDGRSPATWHEVQITNTCISFLEEIQDEWGGNLYVRPNSNANWLPKGDLKFQGDAAIAFLEAIYPYLKLKATEAWLVLEFRANCRNARGGPHLSLGELALREGYHLASRFACHNRELVRRS